ncbi:VOC family protein [Micromonospora sp. SH-82]|uniref:VOC family protein n=1 Tax=Micromonospora sp. SH-82 TaxID=3132938 RepID=UPI003EBEA5E2
MIARFKDLVLDAADARALGAFWARVLGGELVEAGDRDTRILPGAGRTAAEGIWVNQVPEPRTGRTRVHLDLRLDRPDPGSLLATGARLVREPDSEIDWWVLADPEGNLFCAFPPGDDTAAGPIALVVDASDPLAQATWWAAMVGGRVRHRTDPGQALLVEAAGFPWGRWVFDLAPERRTVKNRLHWDVDLTEPTPAALIRAGATLLREPDATARWWVLTDPEGNEFCAFPPA